MTIRNTLLPAAALVALLGGAAITPLPAQAQAGRDGSSGAATRDQLERPGQIDLDDRYPSQYPYGRPGGDRSASSGDGGEGRRAMMEGTGRDAFDRGYRVGRDDERRRQAAASGSGRSSGSSGDRAELDRYWYIPDILPDTPRYRGMQDYALMPDYSRQMDRVLIAAQSLREAIQSAAQLPTGERRNRAIDRLHEALLETQQAMALLPQEARTR